MRGVTTLYCDLHESLGMWRKLATRFDNELEALSLGPHRHEL
jgi:hypothetical protein